MALVQEPEVQLAQRLASNEKPIRTKAVKKLRKYINVRSQKATGGFTSDELLKLWKGLFYCLWMQDKPLLQEELSKQISGLLHSFHSIDGQLLYLETFLQTFKREWTGIDRLRMDKFYQLVRFMFRQTFEILKRSDWDSSLISRFLELLTAQLLHSSSGAPLGLQFHVLDLYMTELAVVGSAELTAAQNLTFIEPFCKTAAKTKDQILFRALCNSIFSTIIDQAPFAIDDLMKEMKGAQASDSDSGQASEGDEDEQPQQKTQSKTNRKTDTGRLVNGKKSHIEDEEEEDDDDEDEDDELHHLDDEDAEMQCDEDVGPVLQFDYGALADKLLTLSSRSSTPSHNRKRLYRIIKVLRDLSEGIFPQDEYPEEVSTDEDDDMFGSRKRVKRRLDQMEGDDEEQGGPKSKKSKGKKKDSSSTKQNTKSEKDTSEPADVSTGEENKKKKKKRKKKKKAKQGGGEDVKETGEQIISSIKVTEADTENVLVSEVNKPPSVTVTEETSQSQPSTVEAVEAGEQQTPGTQEDCTPEGTTQTETPPEEELSQSGKRKKKKKKKDSEQGDGEEVNETQTSVSFIKVTDGQTETLLLSEVSKPPSVSVTPETIQSQPSVVEVIEPGEQQTPVTQEDGTPEGTTLPETPPEGDATQPEKKKRKKKKKSEQGEGEEIKETQTNISSANVTDTSAVTEETSQSEPSTVEAVEAGEQQTPVTQEVVTADGTTEPDTPPEEDATQSGKKKKKKKAEVELQVEVCEDVAVPPEKSSEATTPGKKKKKDLKKKSEKTEAAAAAAVAGDDATTAEAIESSTTTPAKKKSKKTNLKTEADEEAPQETPVVQKEKQAAEKKTKGDQMPEEDVDKSAATPAKKKKPKNKSKSTKEEDGVVEADTSVTPRKKRKIPVVFEFEADEIEAAKASNGITTAKKVKVGTDAETPDIPLSTKKSQKKVKNRMGTPQNFITFQNKTTVPTPLFCKTKGSPSTPLSTKKKCLTPTSGSKKVTFGLKNNKTAEFKKTDRSLLLSPDGSSRVPFDPEQKPKCGVLKSPRTPAAKKTLTTKKKSCSTPKSTPKRRPSAADFF